MRTGSAEGSYGLTSRRRDWLYILSGGRNRIRRLSSGFSKKPGLSPGALVFVGEKKVDKVRITVIDYDVDRVEEREVERIEDCFPLRDTKTVTWINIDGLHDVELIEKVGNHFNLHPLLLEDILNTTQRPKFEDFGDYIYVTLKMLSLDEATQHASKEHLSVVLGKNYVISFQERVGDVFDPVRARIRTKGKRIRKSREDYLAYSLIDAVVDGYYVTMERIGEILENIEDELMGMPTQETLETIHAIKRETIMIRRSIWPLREVVTGLERSESPLIKKATAPFIRDLYDHTIQVMDTIESFRDVTSSMMDLYMSVISNRMNEVMKVLTIIATIFIPITFIAGIYGMNFAYMPELDWRPAYFVAWGVIVLVALGMVAYFRRLKWF